MSQQAHNAYYVPHGTHWPIVGSLGMITMLASAGLWLNGSDTAKWVFYLGAAVIVFMLFGWFGEVIRESESGKYNRQVRRFVLRQGTSGSVVGWGRRRCEHQ